MVIFDQEFTNLSGSLGCVRKPRIAIVHHWFVEPWGGAERVVEVIAEMFPDADLFTLMVDATVLPESLRRRSITSSFLQRIPGKFRWRRHLMPLYPIALEQLDLRGYDLVISSESGPAKGVLTSANTCHICYCNSPMRYIWDMYQESKQIGGIGGALGRLVFSLTAHYMRMWDLATASRVDWFIANSENVARRIRKHYRRDAQVMHCPVDTSKGFISEARDDYYLILGRLVDYKRVDLAIQACNRLGRRLKVVGRGAQAEALRGIAGHSTEFVSSASDAQVGEAYANCRALLFPGEEDFGLVPVEAQSYGRPVIALGRGGALETVAGFFPQEEVPPDPTGVFFAQQSVESLMEAISLFESVEGRFSPAAIRAQAQRFDTKRFKSEFMRFVAQRWSEFCNDSQPRPRMEFAER